MDGVVKVLSISSALVFSRVPPVRASYHLYTSPATAPLAESVTVPVPQRDAPVVVGSEGGVQDVSGFTAGDFEPNVKGLKDVTPVLVLIVPAEAPVQPPVVVTASF